MDLAYGAEYEVFRAEVARFLARNWPPEGDRPTAAQIQAFREAAIEAGYLARNIPKRYGGSEQASDVLAGQVIREEFGKAGAPGDVPGLGPNLLVPTLLEHGTEWQKEKFVAPTMRGEFLWCQGYSEPGSGSDLASLQTKAVIDGDDWVINGQKIWTSGAQVAHYMFVLCRTEPDAQKHGGISYLLLDMSQPGIEVRPLKQMTGTSDFNEVFFSDVRTPKDWIVGKRGEGWIVSRSTLKHERNMIGNATQTNAMFRALMRLAKRSTVHGRPALENPEMRQRLAVLEGYVLAHEYSSFRQLAKAAKGEGPGVIGGMNKLNGTNMSQRVAHIAIDLIGDDGLLEPVRDGRMPPDRNANWVSQYMSSLGGAIAGGTANIQRNVIAERALGLPRDWAASRKSS